MGNMKRRTQKATVNNEPQTSKQKNKRTSNDKHQTSQQISNVKHQTQNGKLKRHYRTSNINTKTKDSYFFLANKKSLTKRGQNAPFPQPYMAITDEEHT